MPVFKDANGREWQVKIDGPKIKEVRQALSFDLADDTAFQELALDEVLLVDVLWVLCRAQANGVTDVQFGEALVGDPIDAASLALMQARLDFFPQRKRSLLRSLAEKQAAVLEKGTALAMAKLNDPALEEGVLAKMKAEMEESVRKILTGPSGATTSPESAASAPQD